MGRGKKEDGVIAGSLVKLAERGLWSADCSSRMSGMVAVELERG